MASEIRVDKITSLSGVGTITPSPTGIEISGITTIATLKATTGIVTTLTATTGIVTTLTANTVTSLGAVSGTTATFSSTTTVQGALTLVDTIVHSGDDNTKIRFPDADTITAETGGSERLRIDSSGRVLIGSTAKAGDSALQVYTSDQLHPAIRVHSPNANGFTLFGDAYQTDESNMNIGISYSSASLVISQGCKVSTSSDDAYVSSQDSYSTKPNVFRLDTDGSFSFLNTNTSATTTTDSAVSLSEKVRVTSAGNVNIGGDYTQTSRTLAVTGSALFKATEADIWLESTGPNAVWRILGSTGGNTHRFRIYDNTNGKEPFYIEGSSGSNTQHVHVNSGNLVFDANGTGIDFSATGNSGGTMSSELFSDYEEGSCVPTQINGSFTASAADGRYTRVGRICTWMMHIVFDSTSSSNHIRIGNFPFTAQGGRAGAGILRYSDDDEAYKITWHVDGSAASASGYYSSSGGSTPSSAVSGRRFDITFVYEVA